MKTRTTKPAVMASHRHAVRIGYGDAQNLLDLFPASGYTAGTYGWNADVYSFGNVAVVTGYRPFGDVRPSYATVRRYDDAADEILRRPDDVETKRNVLRALIDDFLAEVLPAEEPARRTA